MPTFASIGLHPDLQIFAKKHTSTATGNTTAAAAAATATVPSYPNLPNDNDDSDFHVISTPMELLNRNPKQQLYHHHHHHLPQVVAGPSESSHSNLHHSPSHCHCHRSTTTTTTTTAKTGSNVLRPIPIRHIHRLRYQVARACLQQQQQPGSTGPRPRRHHPEEQRRGHRGMTTSCFTGMVTASHVLTEEPRARPVDLLLPTGCPALDQQLLSLTVPPWRQQRHVVRTQLPPQQQPSSLPECCPNHGHCNNNNNNNATTTNHPTAILPPPPPQQPQAGIGGGGGIPLGQITQISGPPASGKTQFVLSLMASSVATTTTPATTIFWIGNSTAHMVRATQRLQDMLRSRWSSSSSDRITPLLQRIHCTVATTSYQLLHRLQEFETSLLVPNHHHHNNEPPNEPPNENAPPTVLLVIDSCSGCCTDVMMHPEHGTRSHTHLVIGQVIRRLTRQYHFLATILINGTVSNTHHHHHSSSSSSNHPPNRRTSKPALGYRWNETIPDICLWFQPCGTTTLYDHRHQAPPEPSRDGTETNTSDQNVTPNTTATTTTTITVIQVTIDRYPRHVTANLASSSSIYFGIGPKGIQTI